MIIRLHHAKVPQHERDADNLFGGGGLRDTDIGLGFDDLRKVVVVAAILFAVVVVEDDGSGGRGTRDVAVVAVRGDNVNIGRLGDMGGLPITCRQPGPSRRPCLSSIA